MASIFFKENLKKLRKKSGESQAIIASLVGKRTTAVSSWELGLSEPSFEDLCKISDYFGISVGDLLGISLDNVHLIEKSNPSKKAEKVHLNVHPTVHLNAINEPSEVYKTSPKKVVLPTVVTVDSGGKDNIVHVPVRARAGYLIGYGDPQYIETLYSYNLPALRTGTYRSFEVDGLSMSPTLRQGDWVVCSWVESLEQIRENRVHVVVTKNDGVLIKRVLNRVEKRGKLYLKSDTINNRADYPIIEIDPSEIAEIWYANIKFSSDFSEPSELFTRINDLELDVLELKKQNRPKQ